MQAIFNVVSNKDDSVNTMFGFGMSFGAAKELLPLMRVLCQNSMRLCDLFVLHPCSVLVSCMAERATNSGAVRRIMRSRQKKAYS